MKLTSTIILGVFTSFAMLAACDSGGGEKKEEKKAEAKKEEVKAEAKKEAEAAPKEEKAAEPAGGGGADSIGIAECDAYIKKFMACIDKMPEAVRGAQKDGLKMSVDAWKQAASGPGKDALATACKAADEGAKAGMEAMGCTW